MGVMWYAETAQLAATIRRDPQWALHDVVVSNPDRIRLFFRPERHPCCIVTTFYGTSCLATPLGRFLAKDGDHALMTRVIRFLCA